LEFMPEAVSTLARLKKNGLLRIMVTNQPDVALGYMAEREWEAIQKRVELVLGLDLIKMCRHTTEQKCPFKKPSPLMLLSAADDLGIDLAGSYMVGDTDADIGAGHAAGCKTILIASGEHNMINWKEDCPIPTLEADFKINRLMDIFDLIK